MVTMKKSVTMEAVKSLLLEWDGDGSGLEAVETAGGTLYKVADVIVQNEDIPGMTVTDNEGKETLVTDSVYNDMISRSLVGEGFAAKVAGYVYLAQKAAQAPGAELPAGGIWLLKKQDGSYPKKVVLPAYREAFLQGEKPDGEKGESMGGGVTSWNDLKDRPFGETTVKGDTLEWDGNTDERVVYDGYAKVSDAVLTIEEINKSIVTVKKSNGDVLEFTAPFEISTYYDDRIAVYDGDDEYNLFYVWKEGNGKTEPGIYFFGDEEFNITTSLTIPGYGKFERTEIKTLDPKFLPEGVPYEEGKRTEILPKTAITTAYDNSLYGNVYEFEQGAIDLELGKTYQAVFDGNSYACECKLTDIAGMDVLYIGNTNVAFGDGNDTGEPFALGILQWNGSTVLYTNDESNHTFGLYEGVVTIKTLDPKFLEMPFIDLVELGLPALPLNTIVEPSMDIAPLLELAGKKPVRIRFKALLYGTEFDICKVANITRQTANGITQFEVCETVMGEPSFDSNSKVIDGFNTYTFQLAGSTNYGVSAYIVRHGGTVFDE